MIPETRQQKMAKIINIPLENLAGRITGIPPSENHVTKKSIMEIASKRQRDQIKYFLEGHAEDGLTIQHLDPRQNRYNSVRYQFLKLAGNYLGERTHDWKCDEEGCDFIGTVNKIYYVSFGEEPLSICMDIIQVDDDFGLGSRPGTNHLLDKHGDVVSKKLSAMGVKT